MISDNQIGGRLPFSRRSVLKQMSGSVGAGLVGLSGIGTVAADSKRKFVGVTYDTRTHQVQRPAHAQIQHHGEGEISGKLQLGGFNIKLGDSGTLSPYKKAGPLWQYYIELTEPQYTRDGEKLICKLEFDGHHIVGIVTRPSDRFADLSYTMNAKENGASVGKIRKMLSPEEEAKKFDEVPDISEKGVPTSTSLKNLKPKGKKKRKKKDNKGGEK
ncbi:hypothetical protein [Halorhabdus sp. CBA1104]|uniref:hypothetical protein n=1 Tax=Halorhabdus sp. CBA1104 TaxID=1380432 RepID=UPI0012B2077E|nr:hypothetical protein [Halorhabdus sp. CBA1104]